MSGTKLKRRHYMSDTPTDAKPLTNQGLQSTPQPLKINVRKAFSFMGPPEYNAYSVTSRPRGSVLIINNENFAHDIHKERTGSSVDVENLKKLFSQLDFEVEDHKDLGKRDLIDTLHAFSKKESHKESDMAVVCVLSHGSSCSKIATCDNQMVDVEADIITKFDNYWCPLLKGKPKLFIFQACRGDDIDIGVSQYNRQTSSDAGPSTATSNRIPTVEDIMVVYATVPDRVAYRNECTGSWLIESFCQVMMEHAADTHLSDILSEKLSEKIRSKESERGFKQSTEISLRHFRKKVFLNPGIQPTERNILGRGVPTLYDDSNAGSSINTMSGQVNLEVIKRSGRTRRLHVQKLRNLSNEIDLLNQQFNNEKIKGNGASLAGGSLTIVSGIATIATGGLALPVLGTIGTVAGVCGGVWNYMGSNKKTEHEKRVKEMIQQIVKEDEAVREDVRTEMEKYNILDHTEMHAVGEQILAIMNGWGAVCINFGPDMAFCALTAALPPIRMFFTNIPAIMAFPGVTAKGASTFFATETAKEIGDEGAQALVDDIAKSVSEMLGGVTAGIGLITCVWDIHQMQDAWGKSKKGVETQLGVALRRIAKEMEASMNDTSRNIGS